MATSKGLVGKILSGLILLGGVVLLVSGCIAWNMASTELASQKIDVSGNQYELDGKEVPEDLEPNFANGPFDALSQIELIQLHTDGIVAGMGFPEGTVYSEIPMPDSKEVAACKAGKSDLGEEECATAITNDAARNLFDNSNNKQAALYTSVLAFGVSALVVGLGLVLLLVGGLEFTRFSGDKKTPATSAPEAKNDSDKSDD